MPARLEVVGLEKAFPGLRLFSGLDLSVVAGEVLAICGVSGTGKSTLLNCIGLLDRPDGGSIAIDGERVDHLPVAERSRVRAERLGFVFQGFHLLQEFTVSENILMAARCARLPLAEAAARARELLQRCQIDARAEARVDTLSGGERQRVALCRALLLRPPLILADEPTGNLDPATGGRVFDLLLELAAADGSCVVMVTHNPELAARCHRRLFLREGRLQED
jgi:ABC-type lipoprotein export system ATPase subunit